VRPVSPRPAAQHGVRNIWLIDPRLEVMSVYRSGVLEKVTGDVIATGDGRIEITRSDVFQQRTGPRGG
jgi:hypothetical protein